MEEKLKRQKELTELLNRASKAYYMGTDEIMSNLEYDRLYDELVLLEKETGIVSSQSPTVKVGYEVVSALPKMTHEFPMLSLDKTKEVAALEGWLENQKGVLSWKMDGLTVVLTYEGGTLKHAVTRGNGYEGEVITPNARAFENIPAVIPFKGKLTLRGEAVIKYSDFQKINEGITEESDKYKNPRNLCSGSVRQLSSEITAQRHVHFFAFAVADAQGVDFGNSVMGQFEWLKWQGFDVVEHVLVDAASIADKVAHFSAKITTNDFPSDGLVLLLEDIAYGESLGMTAKFPRNAIAFKWADEQKETVLTEVEWSASRTGRINPVAIFEPVELEGTTVSRASLHNISIIKSLKLGIGDRITVYKANMIIPQLAENLTMSDTLVIPDICPVCAGPARISELNATQTLMCDNPDCDAKQIKKFAHFVSRDAMNIEGLSEETLDKLLGAGIISTLPDLFRLAGKESDFVELEGLGKKSFDKLMGAVDKARQTTLSRIIYSCGINGIGLANAKLICRYFKEDARAIMEADADTFTQIDGIGPVLAAQIEAYFADPHHREILTEILSECRLTSELVDEAAAIFEGKTFVITGAVHAFANRKALQTFIEEKGGKVAGSVSAKTSYLINNDATSASSKNKKAREIGIPILTEEDFLAMAGGKEDE